MEGDEAGRAGSAGAVASLSPPRAVTHRRRENAQSIKASKHCLSDSRRSGRKDLRGNYGDNGRTRHLRLWVLEGDFKAVTPVQRPANPIQPGAAMTSHFLVERDWL